MVSVAPSGSASTFLWIGDGDRPTYGAVEHFLRWRWPELSTRGERHRRLCHWRLYTLDCRPTPWPLADFWPRAAHLQGDFLVWDAMPYAPYGVVFVDNILCSGHATQSADPTTDTWESSTLQGQTRHQKLARWAMRLAALGAVYVLTSGTADPADPEDGDVIPDLTDFNYTLVASRRYDPKLYTGWYIWHLSDIGGNPSLQDVERQQGALQPGWSDGRVQCCE